MRIDQSAASRYAEAVFRICLERGTIDQLEQDVSLIETVYLAVRGRKLRTFIENPVYLSSEKVSVVNKAFGASVSPLLLNLCQMLIRRGRMLLLPAILQKLRDQIAHHRGIIHGTVTTAIVLSDEEKSALTSKLRLTAGEGLQLRFLVDPAIIAGVVVKYGDTLIDDSMRTRIKRLTDRLQAIELRRSPRVPDTSSVS